MQVETAAAAAVAFVHMVNPFGKLSKIMKEEGVKRERESERKKKRD
jgi:hypothetical protein